MNALLTVIVVLAIPLSIVTFPTLVAMAIERITGKNVATSTSPTCGTLTGKYQYYVYDQCVVAPVGDSSSGECN